MTPNSSINATGYFERKRRKIRKKGKKGKNATNRNLSPSNKYELHARIEEEVIKENRKRNKGLACPENTAARDSALERNLFDDDR